MLDWNKVIMYINYINHAVRGKERLVSVQLTIPAMLYVSFKLYASICVSLPGER